MSRESDEFVWIPCEASASVFSDERRVSIRLASGTWDGRVDVNQLRERVSAGPTAIRATIVESSGRATVVRLPGQTKRTEYVELS